MQLKESQSRGLSQVLPSISRKTLHPSFRSRPRRFSLPTLPQLPEPQLLRLRPTSLRTQDISHLLTGVFRNLYTAEVFGDDVSTNLIKARGSEDDVHEEFVDELQQVTRGPAHLNTGDASEERIYDNDDTDDAVDEGGKAEKAGPAAEVPLAAS
ncbi:PREDICTED: deleted in lung and esophageal cancer protein 1 homolog [Myotis davidii]|uniref:deleted in lung and esophageal cancer protein 1 homolog n=1 Tax=Myotis davidii TaxID=225400 RepID=UPI000767145E|nr:PREDICTED: deleted in lung and esophageal cancer protein 1 homolog [Myotis davidii]